MSPLSCPAQASSSTSRLLRCLFSTSTKTKKEKYPLSNFTANYSPPNKPPQIKRKPKPNSSDPENNSYACYPSRAERGRTVLEKAALAAKENSSNPIYRQKYYQMKKELEESMLKKRSRASSVHYYEDQELIRDGLAFAKRQAADHNLAQKAIHDAENAAAAAQNLTPRTVQKLSYMRRGYKKALVQMKRTLEEKGQLPEETCAAGTESAEITVSDPQETTVPVVRKLNSKTINWVEKIFHKSCGFVTASANGQGPTDCPSVAFLGRSNVGKSTLINALVARTKVMKTSSNPKTINFFSLNQSMYLVDMPGFGHRSHKEWGETIVKYLANSSLRRAFVLIDSRRGFSEIDTMAIRLLLKSSVPYQIVLTKIDKLTGPEALRKCQSETYERVLRLENEMNSNQGTPSIAPFISVSSNSNLGISDLRYAALKDCGLIGESGVYVKVQENAERSPMSKHVSGIQQKSPSEESEVGQGSSQPEKKVLAFRQKDMKRILALK